MKTEIESYFKKRAKKALIASAKRVSDLNFFQGVLERVKKGEDLSAEIPALKQFKKTEAVQHIQVLIKRCKKDLKQGYWTIDSQNISTKIATEISTGELVPRYRVAYKITLPKGQVLATVNTVGVNILVNITVKDVDKDLALDQANQELVIASLKTKHSSN